MKRRFLWSQRINRNSNIQKVHDDNLASAFHHFYRLRSQIERSCYTLFLLLLFSSLPLPQSILLSGQWAIRRNERCWKYKCLTVIKCINDKHITTVANTNFFSFLFCLCSHFISHSILIPLIFFSIFSWRVCLCVCARAHTPINNVNDSNWNKALTIMMNKSVFPFSFWSLQCFQFNFFLLQFTTYKYGRMCR